MASQFIPVSVLWWLKQCLGKGVCWGMLAHKVTLWGVVAIPGDVTVSPLSSHSLPRVCYHRWKPAQLRYTQYAHTPKEGECFSPGAHMKRPEKNKLSMSVL